MSDQIIVNQLKNIFGIFSDNNWSCYFLCREEDDPVFLDFEPGSIHDEKFRAFWRDVLKADEWVMSTLDKGYMIPFHSSPTVYEEPNKY